MSRFAAKDIDSRVFRSVHWADWVEAFGRKRLAAVAAGLLAWDAAQHVLAVVDTAQFAKLASWGFFGFAGVTKADVDKALDDVLKGLRAMEGLEEGRLASVGHVSRGVVSADLARLVEEAVKAKLESEVKGLIRVKLAGEAAPRGEFDRFAANAAVAVEVALRLVNKVLEKEWEAKPRVDVAGRENYAHVLEKPPRGLKFYKRDVVHYLRYEVGDVVYGGARAEGVAVLVFLGGEKTIRVEVLAKSVAGPLSIRFEKVKWSGEKWVRLATVMIAKPGVERYVAYIKLRLRIEDKVRGGAAGVEGLRGLLMTDAYGKEIGTPDPLLVKLFIDHLEKAEVEVARVTVTEAGFALTFKAKALDDKPFEKLFNGIVKRYGRKLKDVVGEAKSMWLETMRKLSADIKRVADEAAKVGKREGAEAGRKALVEGLKRLFEERSGRR